MDWGASLCVPISNLLDSFDFVALAAELLGKDAGGKEILDFLGAKVSCKVLKLIKSDFNADFLSDFDGALGLFKYCLVRDLFIQQMEQELVNIVLLILVLLLLSLRFLNQLVLWW